MKYSKRTLIPFAALLAHAAFYFGTDAYQWMLASLLPRPVVHFLADRFTGQFEEVPWLAARFASASLAVLLFLGTALGAWCDRRERRSAYQR